MNTAIFPRDILPNLTKWLDRREAYAIKGPRQSGKTRLRHIKNQLFKSSKVPLCLHK